MTSPNPWPEHLAAFFAPPPAPPAEPRALAVRAPQPDADIAQLLVLEVFGRTLAVDLLSVAEVVKTPPITRVPRMPAHHLGIAAVRGSLMPIVCLAQYLGTDGATSGLGPQHRARVVVLPGAAPVGLAVLRVVGVVRLRNTDILPPAEDAAGKLPSVVGFAALAGGLTPIVDARQVE